MSNISLDELKSEFGADRISLFTPDPSLQSFGQTLTPQVKLALEVAHGTTSSPFLPAGHAHHLRRLNGIGFTLSTRTVIENDVSAILAERLLYLIGMSDKGRGILRTVLHETLLNAAIHGSMNIHSPKITNMADYSAMHAAIKATQQDNTVMQRLITVVFAPDAHLVRFVVCDEGSGFDIGRLHTDLANMTETKANGRGLKMIQAMAESIAFHDGGSTIEFAVGK